MPTPPPFLTLVINWTLRLIKYVLGPSHNNHRVNFFDTWLCNYNIKHRHWRIPELCNYIHSNYGKQAELKLYGQRVVIVTDNELANELMTKHGRRLRQRLVGNQTGLAHLNMASTGLIWNNNVASWKNNRQIFEKTLNKGLKLLDQLAPSYLNKLEKQLEIFKPISMLRILRLFAVSMTIEGLFEIETSQNWKEQAIKTVGKYFKAWEFFLLTPDTWRFSFEEREHQQACHEMHTLSKNIYKRGKEVGSEFIAELEKHNNNHNQTVQCITEMLLAGTDTSSLAMFYTLLFLSDHPKIGDKIAELIVNSQKSGEDENQLFKQITHVYYEAMRLIPVGPVILRQAESDIKCEGVNHIFLAQGDGVIFNIAGMNRVESIYANVADFDPSRFQNETLPLSFGLGKKSCVGKQFAEKEMKMFFIWFLKKYNVLGNNRFMARQLETRWDIANSPVDDIYFSIFPRVPVFLIGNPTLCSEILDKIREEYPNVKYVNYVKKMGGLTPYLMSDKYLDADNFYSTLIQRHRDTMKELENRFGFIQGSILDVLCEMKQHSNIAFLEQEGQERHSFRQLIQSMEHQLIIRLPGKDKKLDQFLTEWGLGPYYTLQSTAAPDQIEEIWHLVTKATQL